MWLRFTNTAILALVIVLTLTGIYGIVWTLGGWAYEVHRIAGWALIATIPWKAGISWRSLKRGLQPRFDRSVVVVVSVLLVVAALAVIGLGLVWAWNLGPWALAFRQSAISLHWILALVLVPPFVLHAWRRWPRPRREGFTSRRAALRMLLLGGAGVVGWWLAGLAAEAQEDAGSRRRVTGSRESGSFSGNDYPVTSGVGEGAVRLEAATWRLAVGGAVERPLGLAYADLLALPPAEVTATIDCTTGWYSRQVWRGVWLSDVLDSAAIQPGARTVRLASVTDYVADYTLDEAREILLATHVGDEPLHHWHGYPLRAVVPSRRGWFWVKWMTRIEVLPGPPVVSPDQSSRRVVAFS